MNKIINLTFIFLLTIISCNNKHKVDVSNISVEIEINRLDQDLYNLDLNKIKDHVSFLKNKYGNFLTLYNHQIIKIGSIENPAYHEYLKGFLTDYTINKVFIESNKVFSNLTNLNSKLTNSFKYYKYYFPQKEIPNMYTFIGGFNQSIVIDENIIGIGLDKYLGTKCDFYGKLGIPKYIRYNMHKDKIISDCMKGWILTEFVFNDSINNVLTNMLYHGKVMCLLDLVLVDEPDSLKFGFKPDQILWCENNEGNMWDYLIEHKQLFETDHMILHKYFNDSPYTKFFTTESPGKALTWLGREIIRSYMKNNPLVTPKELMNDNDYQKILRQSKYKP